MPTISGYLERVIYYNEENDFIVAKLKEKGKKELTTIIGNLSGINPGESLRLSGKWVHDKKFGEQFRVDTYQVVIPATVNGIKKYLGSGLIKGIGPIMAERIVRVFGLDTLDVIDKEPSRLAEVDGIGEKRISMITRAWQEQKEIRDVMVFLQGNGISAAYAAKIYKQYRNRSIELVRENPYRLATDIKGIGFLAADKIAKNIGIEKNSPIRAKAAILYMLSELSDDGHVYFPYNELIKRTEKKLEIDENTLTGAISSLLKENRIYMEETEDRAVYLASFYVAEKGIALHLKRIKESSSSIRPINSQKALEWVEERLGITLAERQREAVLLSTNSKVLIITGGPGTGKTTIIRAILKIFGMLKVNIILCAPTGRAAKRMSEATGFPAKTIHRLLEYSPKEGGFKKNEGNPLSADLIIVDESSMIDTLLMYHMLKAVPSHAHLILVGDINQLPSVGAGNVLRDIISSNVFPVVTLNEIFRQAKRSMIVINAHRVNSGRFPLIKKPDKGKLTDFYFICEEEPEKILSKIIRLCKDRIPRRFGYNIRDIQVITPMNRGIVGTSNLNAELQRELNQNNLGLIYGSRIFKLGDKVMQVSNNYEKEVFNGDIGWVSNISQEDGELEVEYDGRKVVYERSELDEITLAYAVSVHKSQGSEYPVVIVPVVTQHYILLQRNLIYTAITRAKRLAILIGTKKALAIGIKNNKVEKRYTYLRQRLEMSLSL